MSIEVLEYIYLKCDYQDCRETFGENGHWENTELSIERLRTLATEGEGGWFVLVVNQGLKGYLSVVYCPTHK